MLKALNIRNVGPAKEFDLEFGERLSVLTGDNGLGKSLLLDIAWWAYTEEWPNGIAVPREQVVPTYSSASPTSTANSTASIKSSFVTNSTKTTLSNLHTFYGVTSQWNGRTRVCDQNTIKIYAKLDGGVSISDPYGWLNSDDKESKNALSRIESFSLSQRELWHGKRVENLLMGRQITLCNGLIEDWLNWEARDRVFFDILMDVIRHLSPPGEELVPAPSPVRLPGRDVSDVPALQTPYGIVPITQASAGFQRILGLAYALVWAWRERTIFAKRAPQAVEAQSDIFVIIDEVETHLHPKWQRTLLPALLSIGEKLGHEINIQFIVSTHSPLVLASLETEFDSDRDRLFHLKLEQGEVTLQPEDWYKRGDVSRWLTSDIFDLGEARSLEAEQAIARAQKVMQAGASPLPDMDVVQQVDTDLRTVLPSMDPVWARWTAFKSRLAEKGLVL